MVTSNPPDLESPVCTLSEFIDRATMVNDKYLRLGSATQHAWFRGQTNIDWPLVPKIYRTNDWKEREREIARDFRLFGRSHLEHIPDDELEWLFVMQHHGAPTRLLDWTESQLAALFFAVEDSSSVADAGVWTLNPWMLNSQALDKQSVPLASDSAFEPYKLGDPSDVKRSVDAKLPAAIRPSRYTSRILAQRGAFTIHGFKTAGLWGLPYRRKYLVRIRIAGSAKQILRKQLYCAGISRATLFPDLSGLAADLAYRYSRDCIESG
jgi:hypothetical protein